MNILSMATYMALVQAITIQLWASNQEIILSKSVHNTSNIQFQPHLGQGPFANYLSMEIPYLPISQARLQLEALLGAKLKNRGEAHITVITPPEYFQVLKEKISIQEINQLAVKSNLQSARFEALCLGAASPKIQTTSGGGKNFKVFSGNEPPSTYYVVVKSDDLLKFRVAIQKLYIARGGNPTSFNPLHYFPHITVGFTDRDLHESDGVIKDISTCKLKIVYKD